MRSSGKDKPSELTPAIRFPLERVIESIDPATPGHLWDPRRRAIATSPKGTRLEVRFPLPFRVLAMPFNPR
jgi:hypothetical protein